MQFDPKLQRCPYAQRWCGDWCPLFGEPFKSFGRLSDTVLKLCKRELYFEELIDERVKED